MVEYIKVGSLYEVLAGVVCICDYDILLIFSKLMHHELVNHNLPFGLFIFLNLMYTLLHTCCAHLQVVKVFNTAYCHPPPPGCPRGVYAIMVQCW